MIMTAQAYILINVVLGTEDDIVEDLRKLDVVKEAYVTMGSFDIICRVEVEDTKALRPLVTSNIRSIDGVRQTMTVIVV